MQQIFFRVVMKNCNGGNYAYKRTGNQRKSRVRIAVDYGVKLIARVLSLIRIQSQVLHQSSATTEMNVIS